MTIKFLSLTESALMAKFQHYMFIENDSANAQSSHAHLLTMTCCVNASHQDKRQNLAFVTFRSKNSNAKISNCNEIFLHISRSGWKRRNTMGLLLPHCFLDQFLGLEVCRKVLLCQTKEERPQWKEERGS